eukprot:TRINITY_DN10664_c0_g1_i1.p1 TRINITY_DN10664_c0_g1~~TRINITY_DN10664_c0_g1_i1.p1  ORF type:complete len:147 (-),score=16.51 TRINITY_DN10664_c0_g1_i1:110-550(-)
MKIIIFALIPLAFCAPFKPCAFFEGFGESFAGASCSRDTNGMCANAFNFYLHVHQLINGNMNVLYLLLQDGLNLYGNLVSSQLSCLWLARISYFVMNLSELPFVLLRNYERIVTNVKCIEKSIKIEDYLQAGMCVGDILKILTTSQ